MSWADWEFVLREYSEHAPPATFIVAFLFLISNGLVSQTYLNLEWEAVHGLPDTIDWTASTLDNAGSLIMTGNTIKATEGPNILTAKYDGDGVMLWEKEYNFNNGRDYGAVLDGVNKFK